MRQRKRARISHSTKKRTNKRKAAKSPIIIKASLLIIVIFVIAATVLKLTEFVLTNIRSDFPKLEISLADVTIEEIDLGDKGTIYHDNTLTVTHDRASTFYSDVEIKTRGNSTWSLPKKPYQIKLSSSSGLFNLAPAKKWVLLANYLDPSYLRTDITYYIERLSEENHALNGHFVDLYIDNSYRGLYYISEKVEINKASINLSNNLGIIMEIDNLHAVDTECHYSNNHDCLTVHDLVNADNSESSIDHFMDAYDQLESAISQKDYSKIVELIDVDSFAKYFLINEFTANPDAYSSSFFLYKDGIEDKIHAGPGWDFDFSLSNKRWGAQDINSLSPDEDIMFKNYFTSDKTNTNTSDHHLSTVSSLVYSLLDFPEFAQKIREIYRTTISGHGEELIAYIKNQASIIRDAAYRDQARWKLKTDFDEEVDYLLDWITKRYDHFEQTYGSDPVSS